MEYMEPYCVGLSQHLCLCNSCIHVDVRQDRKKLHRQAIQTVVLLDNN